MFNLKDFEPGQIVADAALSKLKAHMKKKGISSYVAYIDKEGEMQAKPVTGKTEIPGFVIIPENEYQNIVNFIKQKTT